MKFAAALLILGFVAAAALADDVVNPCADVSDERSIKSSESGVGFFGAWHCMSYTLCKDKKVVDTKHCLGWPILPLKQYSPTAKQCEWFWNVKCAEKDA